MIEALRPFLEPQAERITEWREKVRREGFPVGMLALAAGRPYTAALVHRVAGFVPFASTNAEVRRVERDAADAALDLGRTLVDNSAISTGWLLSSIWETLIASFGAVYTTDESRRDAAAASDAPGDRSSGTLGWDLASGRPSLHEYDSEIFDRLHRHASWIWDQTLRFPTEALPPASTERDPEALGVWLMSFEVARALGLPLWADDVGLRTLARNEGVAAFGTDSLLAALVDGGRLTIADADGAFADLREEFYVDLPLDVDWLFQAANDGGSALGPAVVPISRGSFWSDPERALELWTGFIEAIGRRSPAEVAHAVYAGCLGVSGLVPPPQVSSLQAGLLGKSFGAIGENPAAFAASCEAATQACREVGLPDPVELALRITFELLERSMGASAAARWLATSGDETGGDHRDALRRVLFEG
jgi:hypothetical protein